MMMIMALMSIVMVVQLAKKMQTRAIRVEIKPQTQRRSRYTYSQYK